MLAERTALVPSYRMVPVALILVTLSQLELHRQLNLSLDIEVSAARQMMIAEKSRKKSRKSRKKGEPELYFDMIS